MADYDNIVDLNEPLTPPSNSSLKRRADSRLTEEPTSKRTWTEADITPDKKQVPLIPRQQTAAETQLQHELNSAANTSNDQSDNEFMDAEENLADDGGQNGQVQNPQSGGEDFSGVSVSGNGHQEPCNAAFERYQSGMSGASANNTHDFHPDMGAFLAPDMEQNDILQLFPELDNSYGNAYGGYDQQQDSNTVQGHQTEGALHGLAQMNGGDVNSQQLRQYNAAAQVPEEPVGEYAFTQDAQQAAVYDQPDLFANMYQSQTQRNGAAPVVEETQDDDEDEDAEEEIDGNSGGQANISDSDKAEKEGEDTDESMDESEESGEEEEDLYASTFGTQEVQAIDSDDEADSGSDVEFVGQNNNATSESLKAMGYKYDSNGRLATPPLPSPPAKKPIERTVRIPRHTTDIDKNVVPRDISPTLRAFWNFHNRCLHLIPQLSNWSTMDMTRRFWIAVLHIDKKPENVKSEKDFMWMKGNRFSTIFTIWSSYQVRSQVAEDDLVLVNRGHILDFSTRTEELDWFSQKFVVVRAMHRKQAEEQSKRAGFLHNVGIIPEGTIELDDD